MKKDTTKLEAHLERHPTDANSIIALLKINSDNYIYGYDLEDKKKHERFRGELRKRAKNDTIEEDNKKDWEGKI